MIFNTNGAHNKNNLQKRNCFFFFFQQTYFISLLECVSELDCDSSLISLSIESLGSVLISLFSLLASRASLALVDDVGVVVSTLDVVVVALLLGTDADAAVVAIDVIVVVVAVDEGSTVELAEAVSLLLPVDELAAAATVALLEDADAELALTELALVTVVDADEVEVVFVVDEELDVVAFALLLLLLDVAALLWGFSWVFCCCSRCSLVVTPVVNISIGPIVELLLFTWKRKLQHG